jgi:SAM-dependent methyltransferase
MVGLPEKMNFAAEFNEQYAMEQLRRSHHPLRRAIRYFYLNNILRDVVGPTIDLGCGAGQLLRRLPGGSIGLEVNPHLVSELRSDALDVMLYDATADEFSLSCVPKNKFKTLVAAHILEHFDSVPDRIRALFRSCYSLGIERIIVVVPGAKGFRSDSTHKTFIDLQYLRQQGLSACEGFTVTKYGFFPIDIEALGKSFTFHELKLVYQRAGMRAQRASSALGIRHQIS